MYAAIDAGNHALAVATVLRASLSGIARGSACNHRSHLSSSVQSKYLIRIQAFVRYLNRFPLANVGRCNLLQSRGTKIGLASSRLCYREACSVVDAKSGKELFSFWG